MNDLVFFGKNKKELQKGLSLALVDSGKFYLPNYCNFYYISDLHLDYKIALKRETEQGFNEEKFIIDVAKKIKRSILSFVNKQGRYDKYWILFGGDISSNYDHLNTFFTEYCKQSSGYSLANYTIFVPGNHELWSNGKSVDEVLAELESIVYDKHGILMLNNAVIFCDRHFYYDMFPKTTKKNAGVSIELCKDLEYIPSTKIKERIKKKEEFLQEYSRPTILRYDEILSMPDDEIKNLAGSYSETILCGIGFSGYNKEHNATTGLYRDTITTLHDDLKQTHKFEDVYNRLNNVLKDNTVICFTHFQKENWSLNEYNKNWIYVYGHTHNNVIEVSDTRTIFADNQLGYTGEDYSVKFFSKKYDTNPFRYYENGIYKGINYFDYVGFYRSFGENCSFAKYDLYDLILLKKHGIYMFFAEQKDNKKLYLLAGGVKKKVSRDLQYYYDRMINYFSVLQHSFMGPQELLNRVSDSVKRAGGSGDIHGSIVDIDWHNHIIVDFSKLIAIKYCAFSIKEEDRFVDGVYDIRPLLTDDNLNYISSDQNDNLPGFVDISETIYCEGDSDEFNELYLWSRRLSNMKRGLNLSVIREWKDTLDIDPDSNEFKEMPKKYLDNQN